MKRFLGFFLAIQFIFMQAIINPCLACGSDTPGIYQWKNGRIFINSERVRSVDCLAYNGAVYVPMSIAEEWLGQPLQCELTFYYELDNYLCYSGTIKKDNNTVELQNSKGDSLPFIKKNDSVYIPIRTIGSILEMDLSWIEISEVQTIYMRDPLSDEQICTINSFIDTYEAKVSEIQQQIEMLRKIDPNDSVNMLDQIENIKRSLNSAYSIMPPSVKFLDSAAQDMTDRLDKLSAELSSLQKAIQAGSATIALRQNIILKCLDVDCAGEFLKLGLYSMRDVFFQQGCPQ